MEFIPLLGVFDLVNKTASIIEINGNRYDAVSGQLLGAAKKAANNIKRPIDGLSIDGFTRPARRITKSAVERSVHALQRQVPDGTRQRQVPDGTRQRQVPDGTRQRQPQRSKTLMRSSVKKPARDKSESKVKARGFSPDYARAGRAADTKRSSKVQRFGTSSFSSKSWGGAAKIGEVIPKGAHLSTAGNASLSATLTAAGSASHYKLERLLDYALANANAHKKADEQSRRDRRKFLGRIPRWAALSLLVLVLTAIAGVIIWQRVPAASMKLAAVKAHINASMPSLPDGFKASQSKVENNSVVTEASNGNLKLKYIQKLSQEPISSLVSTSTLANLPVQTSVDSNGCTSLSYTDQANHKNVATTVLDGVKKTIEAPTNVDSQQLRQSVCH